MLLHEPIEVIATFQWTLNNDVSLATIATGVTAIGALVIGALQTRRMRRTWQAQNAIDILREMQSETQRAARHTIFGLKGDRIPYNTWTEEEKHKAGVVIQLLNTAAYLAKRRLIPRTILDDLWGDIFRGAYESAHEHFIERRAIYRRLGAPWPHGSGCHSGLCTLCRYRLWPRLRAKHGAGKTEALTRPAHRVAVHCHALVE